MADHLMTGEHVVYHLTCGNLSCGKWWDQPGIERDSPGWLVCPHCNWSAPTNVDRAYQAAIDRAPAIAPKGQRDD